VAAVGGHAAVIETMADRRAYDIAASNAEADARL